jgi:ATF/CREB family transcription factor
MLSGPTGQDYFSESFRGFPTPNESSLRTGLTPGGGGSMFPAASPNSQAIFNLQSGGMTPSTAEFNQSALRAAAANQMKLAATSGANKASETATAGMDRQNNFPPLQQPRQRAQNDPFANHDVSNAANDLLSFATQNGGPRNGQQQAYSMPPQQPALNAGHMPVQPVQQENGRRDTKGSVNSMAGSADTGDFSESGQSEQAKTSRSRGKKGAANTKQAAGQKRKADDAPKGSRKKSMAMSMDEDMDDDDEDQDMKEETINGRKMTDEEKRKNFLERNRYVFTCMFLHSSHADPCSVAALKCRQRKKQWLANLQAKVELFSTENDALSATVTQLREEIVNLKTLLLAHKECPVSQAQGLHGAAMNNFLGSDLNHQNPYGIAQLQPNGVHMGMSMQPNGQMMNRYVFSPSGVPSAEDQEDAQYHASR